MNRDEERGARSGPDGRDEPEPKRDGAAARAGAARSAELQRRMDVGGVHPQETSAASGTGPEPGPADPVVEPTKVMMSRCCFRLLLVVPT